MISIVRDREQTDKDRIVVTGIGVVSSIGIGKEAFWSGLVSGRSGIRPVTLFDTSMTRSKLAGEISDFKPEDILGPKGLRNMDRTTLLTLSAAKLCLDDANFNISEENTDETGVVLGSTMGSLWSISEFDKEVVRNGPRSVNPALFPNTVINSPASQISIRFNIKGFNSTISSGFTSSLDALEYGRNAILTNRASAVLVGGVEELCEHTFKGFYKLGFLSGARPRSREVSSPFDAERNGAVLGEGAAIFLLEKWENAKKRGARIYGAIKGAASTFDRNSCNRYDLKAAGAKRAIDTALKNAGVSREEIDYVSFSANSTMDGDVSESRALRQALSVSGKPIVGSACKSMLGETFSAGGAFQVASSFLIFQNDHLPPTTNIQSVDKRCDVDCIPNVARRQRVDHILISNVSPTGQNSAAVIGRDPHDD
jgi:3-oxoacyl-[acyl-carrier-protein] synthase II